MELVSTVEKAQYHSREDGKFIVISENSVRSFNNLIDAFKYYYYLNAEAALWDITDKEELLEKKSMKLL